MFVEIEMLLSECEYLFSKVRGLALRVGIDPKPRWFKDEIGVTEHQTRRVAVLCENGKSWTYQFLLEVKSALLELERELKSNSEDENTDRILERKLPPRREDRRRGRDLLD